jgi:hypothetical protein
VDWLNGVVFAGHVTIALALLFVMPGLALGPVLVPGVSTPLARIGRAAGVSLLTTTLACICLAKFGLLSAPVLVIVLVAMTVVPIVLRQPSFRLGLTSRSARYWAGAAAATVLAIFLILVPAHVDLSGNRLPSSSTVWYYANLARLVADAGGFPATIIEWGAPRPFQLDYAAVTAHTAGALELMPGSLLEELEFYRVAVLAGAVLFAALLFRRWVSSWAAVLGACLLLATVRLEAKYLDYRPETWALTASLFTLWLVDRALVERSRRLLAMATLGAAVVFLAHAEVFLVLAAAVVSLAIARVLLPGRQSERASARLAPAGRAAVIVAGAVVAAVVVGTVLSGRIGSLRYVTADRSPNDTAFARADEVPPGWRSSRDPTWDFYAALVSVSLAGTPPPTSFFDRMMLPRTIANVWPGLDGRTRSGLVTAVGLLLAPLLAWPLLDRRRRRAIVAWGVFGVVLFAGSYLLFLLAHTYVPARTGPRRLMPYELFVAVLAATWALWAVDRALRRGWHALLPRRGRMLAAGILLGVLTTGAVSAAPPRAAGVADEEQEASLSTLGYDAYRWMDANLPADARILANAYTDGAIAAVAHRTGLLDGRAVYLEDRAFLGESTSLLLGARVLFLQPNGAPAAAYLARNRLDYVLVATSGPDARDLGGYFLFDTDRAALAAGSRYELIQSFQDARLLLYAVDAG